VPLAELPDVHIGRHGCQIVAPDNHVECWGAGGSGQLGDGTTVSRLERGPVAGLSGVVDLAIAETHTCAVRDDGSVWCWGSNAEGNLGTTDSATIRTQALTPVQIVGVANARKIATSQKQTCAVLADASVSCWGYRGTDPAPNIWSYSRTYGTTPFVDACTGGGSTVAMTGSLDEGLSGRIPTPAGFALFGVAQPELTVSTNGWLSFGTVGSAVYTNPDMPDASAPNAVVAAFWDDLNNIAVCKKTVGTKLVIQWTGTVYGTTTAVRFQAILDGSDGSVELVWDSTHAASSATATIGIEDQSGGRASKVSFNSAGAFTPGSSMKLTPSFAPPPILSAPGSYQRTTGATAFVDACTGGITVTLTATGTAPSSDEGLSARIPTPAGFALFGRVEPELTVSSNGWLSFQAVTNAAWLNADMPANPANVTAPNAIVAPFWDDLSNIVVCRKTVGTKLVIQWTGKQRFGSAAVKFQAILDGADSSIELVWDSTHVANSEDVTIGIEDQSGWFAHRVSYNAAFAFTPGSSMKLTPDPPTPLPAPKPIGSYTRVTGTTAFVDACAGGSTVAMTASSGMTASDEGRSTARIAAPAGFTYYERAVPDLSVTTNGWLYFGLYASVGGGIDLAGRWNWSLPSMPNSVAQKGIVAPFWDDLDNVVVCKKTIGTKLVLQWTGKIFGTGGAPVKFQAILDGADSTIEFVWDSTHAASSASATIGFEDLSSWAAHVVSIDTPGAFTPGSSMKFTPDGPRPSGTRRLGAYDWARGTSAFGDACTGGGSSVTLNSIVSGPFWAHRDGISDRIATPAGFRLFGLAEPELTIAADGYLAFGTVTISDRKNVAMPTAAAPNAVVAPFWDDLDALSVCKKTVGTKLIIQWTGREEASVSIGGGNYVDGPAIRFQAILDGSDSSIEFVYDSAHVANSTNATIGIEDRTGLVASQIAFDSPMAFAPGSSWKLTPNGGGTPRLRPELAGTSELTFGPTSQCALMGDQTVRCWGARDNGTPAGEWIATPTIVPGLGGTGALGGVTHLSSGVAGTWAALADGRLTCWGRCGWNPVASNIPTVVATLAPVVSLSAAEEVCVVLDDGWLSCADWPVFATAPTFERFVDQVTTVSAGLDEVCYGLVNGASNCARWDSLAPVQLCGNGLLDDGEQCDGDGCCVDCAIATSGTICRDAAAACDAAEVCNGLSAECPADLPAPPSVLAQTPGTCGACVCSGLELGCASSIAVGAGTLCRAASGACDAAETCDGASLVCPLDLPVIAGTECRSASGACDAAESCDGIAFSCPADANAPLGTICRAAVSPCDAAETCSGASNACPADELSTSGTVCRPAAGDCDVEEVCDGQSTSCPADLFGPAGALCDDGNGATHSDTCQTGGACAGVAKACPLDDACTTWTLVNDGTPFCQPTYALVGTPCSDEMTCTVGEICDGAGACVPQ
jgi:hypothetical protein